MLIALALTANASGQLLSARAQFASVINVPPDASPRQIGSNTQLNLYDGGALDTGFSAGSRYGTSTNVEVNIYGGFVDNTLEANSGSTVNISGGRVMNVLDVNAGAVVNISGGEFAGGYRIRDGGRLNVTGGILGGSYIAQTGSEVHLAGGTLGPSFTAEIASNLQIYGADFRLDGQHIAGLATSGDSLEFNLPPDALLSGTLADGTTFTFSPLDGDVIADGTITLHAVDLPPVVPGTTIHPGQPYPFRAQAGQTVIINPGGYLPNNFSAGPGSTIYLNPGQVAMNFEAVGAEVYITGGAVSTHFDAFYGSTVRISGGAIGSKFDAHRDSVVIITGGSIGNEFNAFAGSVVTLVGGTVGTDFDAFAGSTINLVGREFRLNNVLIDGLTPGQTLELTARNAVLSGTLNDGTSFSFDLNAVDAVGQDYFSPDATLSIALARPGDFDGDNVVDGADFLVWQRKTANFNLAEWRSNFGSGFAANVIPEPASAGLAFLAVALAFLGAIRPQGHSFFGKRERRNRSETV